MAPMNIALIGLGMVADTHLAAIADLSDQVSLKGVLSRSARTARPFCERARNLTGTPPLVYPSVQAIADDPDIAFVILCTPPNARMDIVQTLADAGKPVLMEKPIERTLSASQAIVETCAKAGVPLGVVFQHRMRAASQKMAEILISGELGDLGVAEIYVPWWRDQGYYDEPGRGTYARDGGGVMISQAIHTMDLALSLTGPVRQVTAMARTSRLHQLEAEDFVTAGLEFETGAVGSLVASTASFPGSAESITLHFTKGSARLCAGVLTLTWRDGRVQTFGEEAGTGGGADPMAFTHAWHQSVIEDFANAVATDTKPAITGADALTVHALIDALKISSDAGRPVNLNEVLT